MKTKNIKLSDGWRDHRKPGSHYRVEQITDSLEFETGELLDRPKVAELCESVEWKVTIVPKKVGAR